MQTPANIRGVTLIELMIVIVIAAVLLSFAIPSFRETIDRNRLKAAVETLNGDLQFARSEAIKRNRPVRLVFTRSNGGATWCYGMKENATCDCTVTDSTAVNYCEIDDIKKVVSNADFPDVSITSVPAGSGLSFQPLRGSVIDGNTTLQSDLGKQIIVKVSSVGRVRMCSPSGSSNVAGYSTSSC